LNVLTLIFLSAASPHLATPTELGNCEDFLFEKRVETWPARSEVSLTENQYLMAKVLPGTHKILWHWQQYYHFFEIRYRYF